MARCHTLTPRGYGEERFVAIVTRNSSSKFFPATKSGSIVVAIIMLLPVLKSRARAISELEGACSILDMDTKVQLKRPLTSFAPIVVVLARIAYTTPAPDIALPLPKGVFLRYRHDWFMLRFRIGRKTWRMN